MLVHNIQKHLLAFPDPWAGFQITFRSITDIPDILSCVAGLPGWYLVSSINLEDFCWLTNADVLGLVVLLDTRTMIDRITIRGTQAVKKNLASW